MKSMLDMLSENIFAVNIIPEDRKELLIREVRSDGMNRMVMLTKEQALSLIHELNVLVATMEEY